MTDNIVDLYHGNAADFAKLKAGGIGAVFLKAVQGLGTDPTYQTRKIQAIDNGLLVGAYAFGVGVPSGADQANHFLDVVKPDGKTLLVIDFEHNPNGSSMDWMKAEEFVSTLLASGARQSQIGIYGNKFDLQVIPASSLLMKCFLWIAQYKDSAPSLPVDRNGHNLWTDWTFWQYSDGANPHPLSTDGAGHVDRDRFNGDDAAMRSLWLGAGVQPAPSTPPVVAIPTSILRQGSTGGDVRTLQQKLGITVDGNFGPGTRAAVVAFQNAHGLTADSIVGPGTWKALFS